MSRFFRIIAISLFIIGFPLGSWYYLKKGLNYRMDIIHALDQNLGSMPEFTLSNQEGLTIEKVEGKRKLVISNFTDLDQIENSREHLKALYKIQDQFDKKDDILFFTFIKGDSLKDVHAFYKSLNIKEEKQWHFLNGTMQQMDAFIRDFPFPEGIQKSYVDNSLVVLSDTSQVIRYYYDMNVIEDRSNLITHIAHLMPKAPAEETRMKRELEK